MAKKARRSWVRTHFIQTGQMRVSADFSPESKAKMKAWQENTPKTFQAAVKGCVNHAKNMLRKGMAGPFYTTGAYGVGPLAEWDWTTKRWHHITGNHDVPGGKLAEPQYIVAFIDKMRSRQRIGWPSGFAPLVMSYQNAYARRFNRAEKKMFASKGIEVKTYQRMARPIIAPFATYLGDWFGPELIKQYERRVKRLMKTGKAVE